ncbi:hypothetical protein N2152v2_010670 [Parachlorella kessleri]
MGKGQKRKNAGVGVDFRRVKHKVGKKLPKAQNETDTSFKSRSITLPEQSALQDKTGAAVTHRNLTLKDLLGQCSHYSEKVRREAVRGLGELVAARPKELTRHATLVMETLSERITDGDKSVRSALREALAAPVLPTLGPAALGPFVPLLMAHVCSAMTHLAEPVRADALGFLELLTDWRPDLVATAFLAPALSHFGDLLSKGSRGRSLSAGSLAALHRVVSAAERFLRRVGMAKAAAGPAGSSQGVGARGSSPPACSSAAAPRQQHEACIEGQRPLFSRRCGWPPLGPSKGLLGNWLSPGPGSSPAANTLRVPTPQQPAAAAFQGVPTKGSGKGEQAGPADDSRDNIGSASPGEAAARQLLGHLVDCWADCGPAQLAGAPELPLALCLLSTLRCFNHLLDQWGPGLAGSPHDKSSLAAALLKRVAPVFPVQHPATTPSPPLVEALVQVNVAAAHLLARFLPWQLGPAALTTPGASEGGWAGRLLAWFEGTMRDEAGALPAEGGEGAFYDLPSADPAIDTSTASPTAKQGGSSSRAAGAAAASGGSRGSGSKKAKERQQQQQHLPAEVYQAVLEGTAAVLPQVGGPRRRALLSAVWTLWERSSVRSATRAQALRFWRRLLADPLATLYTPLPPSGEPLVLFSEALPWLQAMPRFLWELGSSNAQTSESALRLLLDGARFACCGPHGASAQAALAALQQQLAPLFVTLLPAPAAGKRRCAGAAAGLGVDSPAGAAAPSAQAQESGARLVPGPLAKQPQRVQELAVDLIHHLPTLPESLLRTTALLCFSDSYPVAVALRLLDAVASKAAMEEAGGLATVTPPEDSSGSEPGAVAAAAGATSGLGGLLLCLLSGCSKAGLEQAQQAQHEAGWRRHEAVVQGACRALLGSTHAGPLAAALSGPLLGLCKSSGSARPLYGALALGTALSAAAQTAENGFLLPSLLAAQLPGVALCFAALCEAAAESTGSPVQARMSSAAEQPPPQQVEGREGRRRAWLPQPQEAQERALGLLRAQPSLLPATLDCITQALSPGPGIEGLPTDSGSDVLAAWLELPSHAGLQDAAAAAAAGGGVARGASLQHLATPHLSCWLAAALRLLEGLLGEPSAPEARQQLVTGEGQERRAEAALAACERAVAGLEAEGHPSASRLRQAATRTRALLANLYGRGL